jgi:glycosyltransferase involved in cell wall biosynthesis
MMQTGVSVVMAVYNGERFVRETIDSVLNQTFAEFELVAVDDGSTDSSLEILNAYTRNDSRVVIVRQNHGGLPAALNAGIRHAKYDLIARIDSDDRMLPNRLERQVAFLEPRPEIAVACSDCYFLDITGKRIGQSSCVVDVERGRRERNPGLFLDFAHPTVMMRKKVLQEVGGYREDLSYGEDRHLWGYLVTRGYSIECQHEFLTEFRLHGGSMTMNRAQQQHEISSWINTNVVRLLEGKPELSREEFRAWKQQQPFATKVRDHLDFKSIHNFKRATRFYGEGKYLQCAFSLAAAVTLNPGRMIKRIASRMQAIEGEAC